MRMLPRPVAVDEVGLCLSGEGNQHGIGVDKAPQRYSLENTYPHKQTRSTHVGRSKCLWSTVVRNVANPCGIPGFVQG